MQPGSVYRMVYRLTLMSLLFVQCNCWMTDVKLTCLYNNPPLPPHTRDLMQLWRRKKTILGRISFLGQSTVRERCRCNIKSNIRYEAGNQTRTTYALSARLCDWQPAPCYQQAWVAATSWLLLSPSLHMTSRWTSIMSEAESSLFEETGEKKKKKHRPATFSVVIFKRQMVEHITVSLKHVEQNSFGGPHFPRSQQLSQRSGDVRKNNIDS